MLGMSPKLRRGNGGGGEPEGGGPQGLTSFHKDLSKGVISRTTRGGEEIRHILVGGGGFSLQVNNTGYCAPCISKTDKIILWALQRSSTRDWGGYRKVSSWLIYKPTQNSIATGAGEPPFQTSARP